MKYFNVFRSNQSKPRPVILLRVMKLTIFIITTLLLPVSAISLAQTITLKQNDITLKQVFNQIRNQTGYDVLWQSGKLNEAKKINVHLEKEPLLNALDQILKPEGFDYSIVDKTIVLKAKKEITISNAAKKNIARSVSGVVVDTTGLPLPGAFVLIKGTKVGTQTNNRGEFSFPNLDEETVLLISFTGFFTQEIAVKGQTKLRIVLKENQLELGDVVVVAYGTQKKSTMIGSVTTINPKELKGPTSNLTTMLAGRVAGVIAYQRSGEPGRDNADFFIRGVTSFGTGKVNPLILINGIEVTPSDLARIQPDDISGFSILKDATASSLYGARGANGVVLVTTKSGVEGKTKFNVRVENSVSANTQNFSLSDNITYMKLANEATATRDALRSLPYSRDKIDNTVLNKDPSLYPNNDWIDLLVKDYTNNSRVNFNLSGGGQKAQFYVSGTANNDNGVLKTVETNNFNSNIKAVNYELRSNVNVNLTKTTELIVRSQGQFNTYNGPVGGGGRIFNQAISSNPVLFPAYYAPELSPFKKHTLFGNAYYGDKQLYNNPFANAVSGYELNENSNVVMQADVNQNLTFVTPGLSTRLMAYTRRNAYHELSRRYTPFYYNAKIDPQDGFSGLQLLNEKEGTEYLSYSPGSKLVNTFNYLELATNYSKQIADKHSVSGMLIYLVSNYQTANAVDLQSSLPRRNQGLSGRFTYGFDDRYLAELNFGYNGSERFDKSHRYGFFPSAGLAWNIANEQFFKNIKQTVNKLKLRGTYGLVGNDQIGNENDRFFYLSKVNMNDGNRGYTFGDNYSEQFSGISISRYENKAITWEKAYKTNVGIELEFFNALSFEIDAFKERRTNILMTRTYIPTSMGLSSSIAANVGEAEGKGLEMAMDYRKSFQNNSWLTLRGNFTYATSKILVNEEPQYSGNNILLSKVGYPISQVYGLIAERYFIDDYEVSNSPLQNYGKYMGGDIKYRDLNGDGQITDLDQAPIGYPTMPEIIYGFGLSYGYKSFDISAFAQGSSRSTFLVSPSQIAPFVQNQGNQNGLLNAIADSHWSEDNRDLYAFYPRLSDQQVVNNNQRSTWWMRNGSFLRLKQIEVGYNLPTKALNKFGLANLRLYGNGTNLFVLSKFKMWDVEMGGNGLGYPVQKVFNLGLMVGF